MQWFGVEEETRCYGVTSAEQVWTGRERMKPEPNIRTSHLLEKHYSPRGTITQSTYLGFGRT